MFTEEDHKLIQEVFNKLLISCENLFREDPQRRSLVVKAFEFANKAHDGVRRKSGEPYIVHPIAVAHIVVTEIGLGVKSVCASLLHDVVEDTDYTVEDIDSLFGAKIASMVDGLTKLKKASDLAAHNSEQAENFRKMLFTLSDDVRVMLIKLADRLHNMRTLDSMLPHKKVKIVSETMYLFAPLAHRLGLFTIKAELENLCFKHSYPKEYYEIEQSMNETSIERSRFIEGFNAPIISKLNENGIHFTIEGREKSIYSVWKKMQKKGVPFTEIYDLFAIRIIFKPEDNKPERNQCFDIYSYITGIYKPKPDRFRDWVSIPKANGYEALHSTVMGPGGVWVEVQIRSQRMNDIAERGFAAHWKYKENRFGNNNELDKWIDDIRNALNSPTEDAVTFLDDFKSNLYYNEIVVFTPNGETRQMPNGATALDFAYAIHSKLGNGAIGAKINHNLKNIYTRLQSGDQVEIISSQSSSPKIEWLDYVITTRAIQSIKHFFKKNTAKNIVVGTEMFLIELQKYGIKEPNERVWKKVLPSYSCKNPDTLYDKIGSGEIKLDELGKILKSSTEKKAIRFWSLDIDAVNPFKLFGKSPTKENVNNYDFEIAECCHPIPGDEIVAFGTDNGKLIIHKKNCPTAIDNAAIHGDRIVKANWSSKVSRFYLSKIYFNGTDRLGILQEVSHIITTQFKVNIRQLVFETHNEVFECNVVLYVTDNETLDRLMNLIQKVKGVDKVSRLEITKKIE